MPTSRFPLRGLAALCLLCVLPRLDALVITQSASFTGTGLLTQSSLMGFTAHWAINQFDPALGALYAVSISNHAVGTATVTDSNGRLVPALWDPFLFVHTNFRLDGTQLGATSAEIGLGGGLGSIILQPGETITYGGPFDLTAQGTFTTGLDSFVGPGTGTLVLNAIAKHGTSSGPPSSITATQNATISYHYVGVEEGGSTLLLSLAAIGLLLGLRAHGTTKVPTLRF